jgi:hypothetical protein
MVWDGNENLQDSPKIDQGIPIWKKYVENYRLS